MASVNVSLSDQMKEWIEERVQNGSFANAEDYMRDLVRRDREGQNRLIQALVEGEESGISGRTVGEIVSAARAKLGHGEL